MGRLPGAPGTYGAALGVAIALPLPPPAFWTVLFATAAIGVWASARHAAGLGVKDPSEVVIDEVSGQLIALAPAAGAIGWLDALIAFAAFRFFDIVKPGPIRWAEHAPGGWGVMADDWLAGAAAALVLAGAMTIGGVG